MSQNAYKDSEAFITKDSKSTSPLRRKRDILTLVTLA